MHTARQLRVEDFDVEIDGLPASREDLLPGWTPWDRLGVVVDRPFGALGANALIQLAITAFYDVRPQRRDGFPTAGRHASDAEVYPEVYVFHVGGRHGFYAAYDVWPARKEVFVPGDPRRVLDVVNDRAITRLLVPDAPPQPVRHEHKEPAAARDRLVSAIAYSPSGRVRGGDVAVASRRTVVQANARQVLAGGAQRGNLQARTEVGVDLAADADLRRRHWTQHRSLRADEAAEHVDAARAARGALLVDGVVRETYQRITVDDALDRLTGALPPVVDGT